jgi:hypothetical protein
LTAAIHSALKGATVRHGRKHGPNRLPQAERTVQRGGAGAGVLLAHRPQRRALGPAHRSPKLDEVDELAPGPERPGRIALEAGGIGEIHGQVRSDLDE